MNLNDIKCELIQTKNMYTLTVHMDNDKIYSNIATLENLRLILWVAFCYQIHHQQSLKRQAVSPAGWREHSNVHHWAATI